MKKLEKLTLKELEFKMTKIPQIIQDQLKGGDVTVTFDRSDSKIYIYADGILIESYSAANNVDSSSQGSWTNETFSMMDQNTPNTHTYDSYKSSFGLNGIYRANAFVDANGCERTFMGLHAGRSDDFTHPTMGGIKTTESAMSSLQRHIGSYGYFSSITVQD
jgi:hypothetical protein